MLIYPNSSSALEAKKIALGQPEVITLASLYRLSFNLMATRFESGFVFHLRLVKNRKQPRIWGIGIQWHYTLGLLEMVCLNTACTSMFCGWFDRL